MQGALANLRKRNQELEGENAAVRAQVAALQQDVELSNRKLQHVLKQLFGRKTEALNPRQLELVLAGTRAAPVVEPAAPERKRAPVRRARPARKPRIPENLPTEEIVIEPEAVRAAPETFKCIGEEITQELDVVSPKYYRRLFIRRKYVSLLDHSQVPVIAALPPRLIPGGYAGVGLLTDIVLKKYLDHLPLYRQEQILRMRFGIAISCKTLADLAGANLEGCDMVGADLTGADVTGANLHGADLRTAHLAGCRLTDAVLVDALLKGACFDHATCWPQGFDPAAKGAVAIL
jgi:transposase